MPIKDIHANYDAVFKDAMSLFKNKALDFFGLDPSIKIEEPLKTENVEILILSEISDLAFMLSDGRGLHMEEETDVSKDDLLRFCGYNVSLARTYKTEFITMVITNNMPKNREIAHECLNFKPVIYRRRKTFKHKILLEALL